MVKVLFCGDTEGHLKEVLDKVKKLNGSKVGPFDLLFCIGRFTDENNNVVIDQTTTFPIPTYIVLKDDILSDSCLEELKKQQNVTVISKPDIITVQNLNVLCIPGVYDEKQYNSSSLASSQYYNKNMIEAVLKESDSKPIDFVLSGEWASGMLRYIDPSKYPAIPNCVSAGSPVISEVLTHCQPRYHFAGSMNVFYERVPYRNENAVITRVICLGPVKAATDKSRKWIHALNIQPRSSLTETELTQCQPPYTNCPFTSKRPESTRREVGLTDEMIKRLERDSQVPTTNYRYAMPQMNSTQSACWFCLAAPSVEKQLIVSIGEHSYLACPKGQLTEGHVLIIPIVHRQSTLQLEKEVINEMNQFKMALIQMFHSQGKAVLLWERNLTTRNPLHCQIQLLPLEASKEMVTKIVLDAAATQRGFRFSDIPVEQSLQEFAGSEDFLYAEVWGVNATSPKRYGYVVRERRPQMQFFHQAVGSLLESTNAGNDWKALQKSVEEETEITNAFRKTFKPFDFTIKKEEGK